MRLRRSRRWGSRPFVEFPATVAADDGLRLDVLRAVRALLRGSAAAQSHTDQRDPDQNHQQGDHNQALEGSDPAYHALNSSV